jgi:hypothetical protein
MLVVRDVRYEHKRKEKKKKTPREEEEEKTLLKNNCHTLMPSLRVVCYEQ